MATPSNPEETRVLVLAPTGRDAALTTAALAGASVQARPCRSAAELVNEIGRGAGMAILADEALDGAAVSLLLQVLSEQPPWSDLPLLVFTSDESGAERLLTTMAVGANVTILQRPTRIAMFLSAVQAALRARTRQYQSRDMLERLEESDRQKDDFLATISHELRTPLNSIVGWTTIMRNDECPSTSHERGLEVIDRSARAQARIVEELLDMARIIAGKVQLETNVVDLAAVVLAAHQAVQPAAEARGIAVEVPASDRPVPMIGDSNRLQQIALNLFTNAVKFTPAGGRVTADVSCSDTEAVLSVSDTGRGIEPEFLPFVFDRFRQADSTTTRSYEGLGLGLSIVQFLVELHGGSIRVESDGLGKGATFRVTLPFRDAALEVAEERQTGDRTGAFSFADVPSLSGLRVLVVDDNSDTVEMMGAILVRLGAEMRGVESAGAGLDAVRTWRPDVIVSDIGMPDHDGFWLIEKVRALPVDAGGETPAIALTALADPDDRSRSLQAGFQSHLRKPVSLGVLATTLADLAGRFCERPRRRSTGIIVSERNAEAM